MSRESSDRPVASLARASGDLVVDNSGVFARLRWSWSRPSSPDTRLAHALKAHDAVIDGEIVCLNARGRSNFKSLLFRREWPYFYAFDLLTVDGEFLGEWPLRERKRRLPRLIPSVPTRLLYVDHVEGRGKDFSQWPARTTLTASWASSRAAANNGDGTSPTGARSRIPRTRR